MFQIGDRRMLIAYPGPNLPSEIPAFGAYPCGFAGELDAERMEPRPAGSVIAQIVLLRELGADAVQRRGHGIGLPQIQDAAAALGCKRFQRVFINQDARSDRNEVEQHAGTLSCARDLTVTRIAA